MSTKIVIGFIVIITLVACAVSSFRFISGISTEMDSNGDVLYVIRGAQNGSHYTSKFTEENGCVSFVEAGSDSITKFCGSYSIRKL